MGKVLNGRVRTVGRTAGGTKHQDVNKSCGARRRSMGRWQDASKELIRSARVGKVLNSFVRTVGGTAAGTRQQAARHVRVIWREIWSPV